MRKETRAADADRPQWRAARYAIGALVAFGALYASLSNLSWPEILDAFSRVSVAWTVAAILSVLVSLALVTVRWGLLLGAWSWDPALAGFNARPASRHWGALWDSVVVGQAVNIVIPLRFGEGARLAMTTRTVGVPVGRVVVALALERAFDAAAFATIVLLLIVSGAMPDAFRGVAPSAALVTLMTLAAVIVFVRVGPAGLDWLRRRSSLARGSGWIDRQAVAMREGWTDLAGHSRLVPTALLTALIPMTAAATNLLVFQGFGLAVPAIAALVLLVALQVGTAVVSVPGNIGVFHYLTIVTLAAWGVPRPAAFAAAVVLHAVALGPKVVLAAISMMAVRGSSHGDARWTSVGN